MGHPITEPELAVAVIGQQHDPLVTVFQQITRVDVATPVTYQRYTGNWRGAFAIEAGLVLIAILLVLRLAETERETGQSFTIEMDSSHDPPHCQSQLASATL